MLDYQKQAALSSVLYCLAIWDDVSRQEGETVFHDVSIGIASGPVSFGNFGSTDQIGFTVLGPTVDRATRLEPASAQCGCRMLLDQETYDLVKQAPELRFRLVPHIAVDGVPEPLTTFEPFKKETVSQDFLDAFHEGVFAMQSEKLAEAVNHFEHAHQLRDGGDATSLMWIEACKTAIREGRQMGIKVIEK